MPNSGWALFFPGRGLNGFRLVQGPILPRRAIDRSPQP